MYFTFCNKTAVIKNVFSATIVILTLTLSMQSIAQSEENKVQETLGISQGTLSLKTVSFNIRLVKASQTIASLNPKSEPAFDFTPGDRLKERSDNGMYQMGDINLRLRQGGAADWTSYSTATSRKPVQSLKTKGSVLAAADLANTLPADIPVKVKRFWQSENGQLVLRFEITNRTAASVEIGLLGIPMIFNNILEGKKSSTGACAGCNE